MNAVNEYKGMILANACTRRVYKKKQDPLPHPPNTHPQKNYKPGGLGLFTEKGCCLVILKV